MTNRLTDDWISAVLSDVADIERVIVDPSVVNGEENYVGLEHINGVTSDIISTKAVEAELRSTKFRFNQQHLLYGKLRPYLKKIARPDFSGVCSTDILPILPKENILSRDYLFHYLRRPNMVRLATARTSGANLPRLSPQALAEFPISFPRKWGEQQRIAAILDKADAIRRKRQQSIQLTDEFLRSVFLDMFGDPAANPHKWPQCTIRDLVAEVRYGTSKKASEIGGRYKILRMNNITYGGSWDLSDLKYIDLTEGESEKYLVRRGDLLFNRTNSKELVGKTAVYDDDEPMVFAGYLIRARMNNHANSHYISAFLNSKYGKAILMGMCKNIIGMANINAEELQDIRIMTPPLKSQDEFASIVLKIKNQRAQYEVVNQEAEKLFRSLSQRAFDGEF